MSWKIPLLTPVVILILCGTGCQNSLQKPMSNEPKPIVTPSTERPSSVQDDFEMKLKCKPFLNEVEKNNEKLEKLGILPLVPYVCYSKAKNTCVSVQGYMQDGDVQWEVKDLLTGEVLNVLGKATSQESGAVLRARVDSVKEDLACVN